MAKRIDLDPNQVKELAALGCKITEMMAFFGVSRDTVYKYRDEIEAGKAELKMSLRRAQIKTALNGNATMLVWLGKQLLDQRDNHTTELTVKNADVALLREKLEIALELNEEGTVNTAPAEESAD